MTKDHVIAHLKMIQDVITRMASNSASMKRYAVIVVGAGFVLLRLSENTSAWSVLPLTIMLGVMGILDAWYLHLEQLFRDLYNDARTKEQTRFTMDISRFRQKRGGAFRGVVKKLCSLSVWSFYLTLALILVSAAFLARD